jgi:hypothetical protein
VTKSHVQPMDSLARVVEILSPLSPEERARVIRAAMVLLGEVAPASEISVVERAEDPEGISTRAKVWMKQNSVTSAQIAQVFHISDGSAELIASLPGNSKKEQTYSAYILAGIGQLLVAGSPSFDDKSARDLCERSGCYDRANHSVHLRNRGNEFTGTKDKGWTLTAPGLRRGAELIKELGGPTS